MVVFVAAWYRFAGLISLLLIVLALSGCVETPAPETPVNQSKRQEYEAAAKELRLAAESGNLDARNRLGILYSEGLQDYVQAKRWFEKAAERGHPGAQVNLGTLYLQGNGVPQSDQMALFWFRQAVEQRDALAFAKMGLMYAQGRGVVQDFVRAHMWYNLSAAQGEKRSAEARDLLAKQMTPSQIAEAQRLARDWAPKEK
ncbi:MAG TPA: tetratricopeptide repeat protein [Nitrospira sp.]|nr:tetratricopeptide repeat protein [Nitrospira sp.]